MGRDPGLSLVRHGSSMIDVPQRFGFLLSRTPDPGALFRATYIKLEPQRRRASFAYQYEDFDRALESALLLRVGLYATANWRQREGGTGAEPARALFWWLYEVARRLWLTTADDFDSTTRGSFPSALLSCPFSSAIRSGRRFMAPLRRSPTMPGWLPKRGGIFGRTE